MARFEFRTIIGASSSTVWNVLTKPELAKQFMSGAEISTDWKVGSPIRWTGLVQGKPYENKGTVLKFAPEQLLEYTYWSNESGLADAPENYTTITWLIEKEREGVTLTIIVKDNTKFEELKENIRWGWRTTVQRIAKVAEEQ